MRLLALLVAVAAAAPAASRAGPSVTLNGVPIDGATDQRFENAQVVIDAAGNIHITAKGYAARVETVQPPAPQLPLPTAEKGGAVPPLPSGEKGSAVPPLPPAEKGRGEGTGKLTRRYFLATEQSQPDGTQYDVEVFVNATWIRVLRSTEPQVVMEVTRFLRPGANQVTLASTKRLAGVPRRSSAADVILRVVIGEGQVAGDQVALEAPAVVMTRTAAETGDRTDEFILEAR